MNKPELYDENHRATYCPEDDKLRLYVGRVPRPEYDALRAEGWTSTPKQSEAGQGEFAATWTPRRADTALSYAGIIEDEDAGPADRAADRAERFSGHLGRRLDEATGHGDNYSNQPAAHGNQSYARAVKAADRHDRHATRAVDAWDKAEYWQHRTAGVIAHALYLSAPGVRMGRIKTIEAELRRDEKTQDEHRARFAWVEAIAADPAAAVERIKGKTHVCEWEQGYNPEHLAAVRLAEEITGCVHVTHPRNPDLSGYVKALMEPGNPDPVTLADIAQRWVAQHHHPESEGFEQTSISRYIRHHKLRIAYELQMLEAQGGRAAMVEMEPGGFIGGHQIHKVNKSPATGRVVSVGFRVATKGKDPYGKDDPKAPAFRLTCTNIERLAVSSYRAPTDEERVAFAEQVKAEKKAAPKSTAPPLINPTLADAQRLQDRLNADCKATWARYHGGEVKPAGVCAIDQATYSANSGGTYSKAETRGLCAAGKLADRESNMWTSARVAEAKRKGPILCKIRITGYDPVRVIHITDKPAKPLPAAVWEVFAIEHTFETLKPRARDIAEAVFRVDDQRTPEQITLLEAAEVAGIVSRHNGYRWDMTETGHKWAKDAGAYANA